jgi:hypothetical protein
LDVETERILLPESTDKGNESEASQTMTVKDIATEYGVHTVHTIDSSGLIEGGRDILIKNILVHPRIELCASTIHPGDAGRYMYGGWGAVLAGGEIIKALPFDHMTHVEEGGTLVSKYTEYEQLFQDTPVTKQVEEAINNRRGYFNEINIRKPEMAGYFVQADDGPRIAPTLDELYPLLQELDMPLYVVEHGDVYQATYDTRIISKSGERIDPVNLEPYVLPEDKRESIIREFCHDFPYTYPKQIFGYIREGEYFSLRNNGIYLLGADYNDPLEIEDALRLYGFAEDQEKKGNIEMSEKALTKASEVLPYDQYQILKSHLKEDGRVEVSEEQLRQYFETGKVNWFS